MTFERIAQFQDSLAELAIGGNDFAVYVGEDCVYRHFSGWQNMETGVKVNENTLFRMFSMTKPLTCALALALYEEGRFLMNEPVRAYLPEFANLYVETQLADGTRLREPARKPMLIEHLFSMTSGMGYDYDTPAMRALAEATGGRYTTRQAAEAFSKSPLAFEPGAHWRYSLSHDVLGALIEVLSGMTFGAYMKKMIFEPLGMNNAWFHEPESETARVCGRYTKDENGNWTRGDERNHLQRSPNFESGGAGLTMTVDDYARFARAMTHRGAAPSGARILAGRTVDLMRMNRLTPAQMADFVPPETRQGYGYGLGVRTLCDPAYGASTSARGEFGWGGAWGTYTVMDPENRVTLVYAEQGVDTQGIYIQRRLRNMAYAALEWKGLI